MKENLKQLLGNCIKFLLMLCWKVFLTCVWACLRGIEFAARVLGDWVKSLITPNDRRNDDPNRKNP